MIAHHGGGRHAWAVLGPDLGSSRTLTLQTKMEEGAIEYAHRAGLVGSAYFLERNADGEVSGFERDDLGRGSFRSMLIAPEIPSRQAIAEIVTLCRSQAEILLTEDVAGRNIRRERQIAEARESPARFISLLNELCREGAKSVLSNS